MSEPEEKLPPILLKKYQLLEVLSVNRNLKGGDFAVFWQIQDHYNQKLGYAYPSFNRLALRTGFSKRNIQNSVSRLVEYGFIEIILHGSRNNVANRYRPNYDLLNDWIEWRENNPNAELGVWKHSSIGNNLGVWNASSQSMEVQFQSYGSTVPSNPSINPRITEGLIVGLSANATSDATLASPLTGLPLPSKGKYKYPEFWNVYPTRKNVGKTEDEITTKLNDGVLLADIVEGARLYAINVQSKRASWKGGKDYTKFPDNFVKDSHWLDDWTITPTAEVKSKVVKVEVAAIIDNPTIEETGKAFDEFDEHSENCKKGCKGYLERWDVFIEKENQFLFKFCAIGKPLYYEYTRLCTLGNGTEKTGDATKEELIDAFYVYRMDEYNWDYWKGRITKERPTEEQAALSEDGFYEIEVNALHLFK